MLSVTGSHQALSSADRTGVTRKSSPAHQLIIRHAGASRAAWRPCAPGGRQVVPVHVIGRDQGAACRLVLKLAPLDDSVPGYMTVAPAEVRSISSKVVHGPSRVPRTPP